MKLMFRLAVTFWLALSAPAHASQAPPQHELTAADAETFFDGLIPYSLQQGDIAGCVLSIVRDGQILLARGYGYADEVTHAPISAERTLFRPGSISKVFVWTSVMQLVEQGKLDLDRDINAYLDFKIPPAFGRPVTLRNLMTHRGGFEETVKGMTVGTGREFRPLGEYLRAHVPARIFAPGEIVAYSNYGTALAGYIVERISGEPFADYVARHIFEPLAMSHSTFVQPLPKELEPLMVKGYMSSTDAEARPFAILQSSPPGGLTSTATDMARFMMAHLDNGRLGDARILEPQTAIAMHAHQVSAVPGVNGFALGFYEESRNGRRIIGHAGDLPPFHSDLHLMLDDGVGFFISFSSSGKDSSTYALRTAAFRAFLDRYFPHVPVQLPTAPTAKADAAKVAGWYRASRRMESSLTLLGVVNQGRISALDDGLIEASDVKDYDGSPKRWREIGPLLYQEVGGASRLGFATDANGAIRYWATDDDVPVWVNEPVRGMKQRSLVSPMLMLSLAAFIAALMIWAIGPSVRRHYHQKLALSPGERRFRWWSRMALLPLPVVLLGWIVLLSVGTANELLLISGHLDVWMRVLYCIGVLVVVGGVILILHGVNVWRTRTRSVIVRLGETLLALAAFYSIWFVLAFGLVSFSVRF